MISALQVASNGFAPSSPSHATVRPAAVAPIKPIPQADPPASADRPAPAQPGELSGEISGRLAQLAALNAGATKPAPAPLAPIYTRAREAYAAAADSETSPAIAETQQATPPPLPPPSGDPGAGNVIPASRQDAGTPPPLGDDGTAPLPLAAPGGSFAAPEVSLATQQPDDAANQADKPSLSEDFIAQQQQYAERFRDTSPLQAVATGSLVDAFVEAQKSFSERFHDGKPLQGISTQPVVDAFIEAQQSYAERFRDAAPLQGISTQPVIDAFLQAQQSYAERFRLSEPVPTQATQPVVQDFLARQQTLHELFKLEKPIAPQATQSVVQGFLEAQKSYSERFTYTGDIPTVATHPVLDGFAEVQERLERQRNQGDTSGPGEVFSAVA